MSPSIPKTMQALRYEGPKNYSIVQVPVPEIGDDYILVKIKACGICGTDVHVHDGDLPDEFPAKYPVIPGHEPVGVVAAVGKNVKRISVGQRVVCGANNPCHDCFFCLRGETLLCENLRCSGVTVDGAFAEYCAYHKSKVVPIQNMTDMEACLVEPASCAAQMLNKVAPSVGSTVLVFGSGPAGLLIAQLFKQNGGCKVVIAALAGAKLDLGRTLQAGDEFVEVGGTTPDAALEELKKRYSHGFDIVVEASGVPKVLENSINFVRRGGKLAIFGVYSSAARVSWSPSKILGDQISIVGSIAEVIRFPVSVDYIESGRVNVKGIANRTFKLEQWGEALESMRQADTVKAAIVFDD